MTFRTYTRRDFLKVASIGIASTTLAACAVPQPGAMPTGDGDTAPTAETTEVRFATDWVEGARGATMDTAMEMWAEQHPDTQIRLEPIGGDYFDRLQIQFSGGTVADVILFEGVLGPEYIAEGLIVDLAPTLDSLGVDFAQWRPGPDAVFLVDDKVYAIPYQLTAGIWFYNKTMFEEKGVPLPDGTWDWDMTLEAMKELTSAPDTYGTWTRVDMFNQYGSLGLVNSDHHWVNEELTHTLVGEDDFAESIRWFISTVQEHKVSPPPSEVEGLLTAGLTNLFATGKIGIATGNTGTVGTFLRTIGDRFEWDIMPTPKGPASGKGGGLWSDQPHVVTSNAIERNVVEESTQLVTFLAGNDIQSLIAVDRGSTPTVQVIQESDVYLSAPPDSMQTILDELVEMRGPLFFPRWLEWYNALNKEYELGLIGERGVEETIEAMVVEGDKVLASI